MSCSKEAVGSIYKCDCDLYVCRGASEDDSDCNGYDDDGDGMIDEYVN
ncbi:MAG: hypothetical protein ACP5KG_01735 [Myxococcota bacterium]